MNCSTFFSELELESPIGSDGSSLLSFKFASILILLYCDMKPRLLNYSLYMLRCFSCSDFSSVPKSS